MRAPAVLLTAALAASVAAGTAQAQPRCPPVEPAVALELEVKPAAVSRERRSAELRRAPTLSGAAAHTGLYHVEIVRSSEVEVSIAQHGERICVAVAKANIRVATPTRVIYVAAELDPESCVHRVTLEHERLHERVDDEMFRDRLPERIAALRDPLARLATAAPAPAAERERLVRETYARAQAVVAGMFTRLFDERERAQLALDTPQGYARLRSLCR